MQMERVPAARHHAQELTSAAGGTAGHKVLCVPLLVQGLPTAQAVGLVLPDVLHEWSQTEAPEERGPSPSAGQPGRPLQHYPPPEPRAGPPPAYPPSHLSPALLLLPSRPASQDGHPSFARSV